MLYPNLRYNEILFHQDHIHPDSRFTNAKLKDEGIPEEKWQPWQQVKDTVPNLQLMEGRQNASKNATPFEEWLHGTDGNGKKNAPDIPKFFADNYIPIDVDYSISNFDEFYLGRKSLLIDQLKLILDTNIE